MEAHGGRIWAESDGPGLGARFTFTLPTVEKAGKGEGTSLWPLSARFTRGADTGTRGNGCAS